MHAVLRTLVIAAAALLGTACQAAAAPPPVRHVFVVVLENENQATTFGPDSPAPYLARTLPAQGSLLPNYYAVTHLSLGNYIALVSGQGSNLATQSDCQVYTDFAGAGSLGQGCVYPTAVQTVAGQLTAKGLTWKGYMEDMGNDPARESATCGHPVIGSPDGTQSATPTDQYAARHNPFVYFHAIIDTPLCDRNDVPLTRLTADLQSVKTTPNYAFITPNLCNDGHDSPCADGRPGGLATADTWLRTWVPRILASPAFKRDGLLLVTFDEAEASGSDADASACCDEAQFPNTPNNGGPTPGRGGGRVGAVVLSPFIRPGTASTTPYNHFSFLRTVEDLFGLAHLGYAQSPNPGAFGADVLGR
jgi:phosphatidylinositol-3-phosphatase